MLSPWADILKTAEDIRSKLAPLNITDHSLPAVPYSRHSHTELYLPSELDLFSDALRSVHPRFLSAISNAAEKLRNSCRTKYSETCEKLEVFDEASGSKSVHEYQDSFGKNLLQLYYRQVQSWVDNVIKVDNSLKNVSKPSSKPGGEPEDEALHKSLFKIEFLPTLEKCFAKNRYPSRAEKGLIARKTRMSYKQIHVWFQNQRSRSKNCEHTTQSRGYSSVLDKNIRVAYAFPTVYPPDINKDTDPFPCRFGNFTSFGRPCWPYQSTSRRRVDSTPDVSALCLAFTGLHIGDTVEHASLSETKNSSEFLSVSLKDTCCDVTSPYTIRPLRAPLFSLLQNVASRAVRDPGKLSYVVPKLQCRVMDVLADNKAARPAAHRPHCAPARESAVGLAGDHDSSPFSQSPEGFITSANVPTPNNSAPTSTTSAQSKIRKSSKRLPASQRESAKSASRCSKKRTVSAGQKAKASSTASSSFHPSPTSSTESLPALSYSSTSSSSSTCSQSPTLSFETLEDDGLIPPLDVYQSSGSCLHLPPEHEYLNAYPPPLYSSSALSFDFSKGPLDITFGLDLPTYPSYSDSFDLIQRGLQFSPDFAPPVLEFDLSYFES